jgi:indole-3-glycerol phosphate synthase
VRDKPTSERTIPAILQTLQKGGRARADELRNTGTVETLLARGRAYSKRSLRGVLAVAPAIIAEVKKASPSKGRFCEDFDLLKLVRAYAQGGAAAISVVTEPKHFQGQGEWIAAIRREVDLPILRKDFIIDAIQVAESAALGADAVLLIARMLTSNQLARLSEAAAEAGIEVLYEAHDTDDLHKIAAVNPTLVGINARDLNTFAVDTGQFAALQGLIPAGAVAVAESGLYEADQIAELTRIGYQGFLIGESLIRSSDPAGMIRQLRGTD